MPVLKNPRHEKFAQALFAGKSAHEGYADAGYKPNDGNCIRLKGNERVQARLAELQAEAAKAAEVTTESLLRELEQARVAATSAEQLGAATQAIMGKAKIAGLLAPQRLEINARVDVFAHGTMPELAEAILRDCLDHPGHFELATAEDKQAVEDLLGETVDRLNVLLKGIAARAQGRSGYSNRQIEMQRITNGSGNRRV